MALLRRTATDALSALDPEHIVGRSHHATLQIDEPYVSAQHASVRWVGGGWEVKDLGSRNGTLVNDLAIKPGAAMRLTSGDRISFGRREQTWELIDDSPPRVMVVPVDGRGEPLFAEGDMLAVPSQEDPRATVFRASDGVWCLERDDEIAPLVSGQVFEAGGQRFRFSCPDFVAETSTVSSRREPARVDLARLRLIFRVSQDEEHVEVRAAIGDRTMDLGSRGHNYLLLLLARRRMTDTSESLKETACGWMYNDDLVRSLKTSPERLNIDIFRIRKQFAGIGLADAAGIVERRPTTRETRIGIASLSIEAV